MREEARSSSIVFSFRRGPGPSPARSPGSSKCQQGSPCMPRAGGAAPMNPGLPVCSGGYKSYKRTAPRWRLSNNPHWVGEEGALLPVPACRD